VPKDVGSGRGDGSALVNKIKPTLALDFGLKSVVNAKTIHNDIVQGDAAELPFHDNYFTSVTMLDVLKHVLEPKKL
jgi:ubiquinone/menaquinone biosynthesis C-methylase UbiE